MASPATTVTDYCGLIARSRLLPEAEVAALKTRWLAENADADADGFRRSVVASKALTAYQATLVQRGHTEGFFVGGYTVLDRIGKGQSAGVYKARHPSGQLVAVKVLPSSKVKDANTLNRFLREGRLLTLLEHPNVVRAFQVGREGPVAFIAMEYLDGETLDELLERRKRLPAPEAVRVVSQALAGLQHLHEKRLVHRDLKPANVMMVPAGQPTTLTATVKILDIGVGRESPPESATDPTTKDALLTGVGTILGTPDYLAPEQARDPSSVDIRADIYSLGCVLFHLIAGRPPYQERTVMATIVQHATQSPAALATLGTDIPRGLQEVFDRLTAKTPGDRYATPAEAEFALSPFLPSDGTDAPTSDMLPSYKAWLETETNVELPAESSRPAPPATDPLLDLPRPVARPKSATAPAPALREVEVEWYEPPAPPGPRRLTDLDRRDFAMLGFGAAGVLLAGAAGYALARLLNRGPAE